MLNSKLTIIIPTHNRPKYLTRVLDYYQDLKCKILIADSSDNKYALIASEIAHNYSPFNSYNQLFVTFI